MIKALNLKTLISLILISVFGVFLISPNTFAATHSLTLTSSGSQSINVSGSSGTAISSDSINVSTTCRYGYNFTINTSVNNNNLYLNGDSSNNASGTYFSPADGSTALNAATNTWGYYYNSNASTTPISTSVFSPVPTLNNPATVKTPLTTPASSNINDNFKIYYGVNSAPEMKVGTYKMIPDTNNSNNDGTIVYTATIADTCMQYTVHFNPAGYFEGNLITGDGSMSDQSIYEGVATALTTNDFTAPNGYYFAGWNTQQDGSGTQYTNQQQVTDIAAVGNAITLYAQWTDCPGNRICYSANGSGVTGEMKKQIMTIGPSVVSEELYVPNFKRDGYGFVAWNTKADGSGTNYGPNQTLEFAAEQYSTGGLKLYAKWVASTGNMQNWTGCSSMNIGDVTALKDTRDNEVYAVAKLADGKCWMIENLRLDDGPELTSANTNNPSLPLTNVYDTNTVSNHLSPTSSIVYDATTSPEGWCTNANTACIDQSRLRTDNTVLFINNTSSNYSTEGNVFGYGNYYNWYSATAGHGKYGSGYGSGYNAPGDICSIGWHLPIGNDGTGDFYVLNTILDPASASSEKDSVLRSYPNNFVHSGFLYGSLFRARNDEGDYWSSSGNSSMSAYFMLFNDATIYPGTYYDLKFYGRTIRCITDT